MKGCNFKGCLEWGKKKKKKEAVIYEQRSNGYRGFCKLQMHERETNESMERERRQVGSEIQHENEIVLNPTCADQHLFLIGSKI